MGFRCIPSGAGLFLLALTSVCSPAVADTVFAPSFSLSSNDAVNAAIGVAQLRMMVAKSSVSDEYVDFVFTNGSVFNSATQTTSTAGFGTFQQFGLTDVWFDDGSSPASGFHLLRYQDSARTILTSLSGGASRLSGSSGVQFEAGASKATPQGSGVLYPTFLTSFSAKSINPAVDNGVNSQSEWLRVTFHLAQGKTYQDAVWAVTNGEFRIGMKAQGFLYRDGSESFAIVPLPPSVLGGVALLGIVSVVHWRRSVAVAVKLA